ncbi:MAG: ATP-binding protein [Azospira oryzae]|jgi:lipoprotein-releasing system ATP-binding protein|nr:MAG: ATP-binding protein [Azospira oryzae]
MENRIVLESRHLCKQFRDPVIIDVLKDITLSVRQGDFVSISGKSGCGKSTLLYVLSTMDTDYSGELFIDGQLMRGRTEKQLAQVRNEKIGFVFQFHYLLNEFTVVENVMLPGLKLGTFSEAHVRTRAMDRLTMLGIEKLADKKANQLSGGEKQRVAIARALINDPLLLLCDEPTGNLDKANSLIVFSIFKELAEKHHQTLLVVTHDQEFAANSHRIITMEDGHVISNVKNTQSV